MFFARKTAPFGPDIQVSMGPRPHLWICACKTSCLSSKYLLYGSQTSSMDLCEQNSVLSSKITSLYWSQTSPVNLCLKNSHFRTRRISLYGSHSSSVHWCTHNCMLSTRISSLYRFLHSPVVLCMQNSDLGPDLQVCMGPRLLLWICA